MALAKDLNVLITGGTGFIGQNLCAALLKHNAIIYVLTRSPEKHQNILPDSVICIRQLSQLNHTIDVVINLAGEPIANGRWSARKKQKLMDSRIGVTQQIIDYMADSKKKPIVFISGSAVGYYGLHGNKKLIEDAHTHECFSHQLCHLWEMEALKAEDLGVRTCLLRTGLVLGVGGGMLKRMLLPFKCGLGGVIGSGEQWMSWVHIDDLVGIIIYLIAHETLAGPFNGSAPNPVTNQQFTSSLAQVLNRPALIPVPTWLLSLLLGEMAEELLLSGQRVVPFNIEEAGYAFKYPQLDQALQAII